MKITEITENINFYDRFGHDTGAQALPYTVEVQDRDTGAKKLISIEAVSRDDARERARDRGYRVVRVVSQDGSGRKGVREHDGRDDEPEEIDDDGRTMADRARRDGRGGDDLDEPETAAKKRKRSLQATRDFNRGRRSDSMREGVAKDSEQVYKVVAVDKSNALKKPTKLNVKASNIEDVFNRLAVNDWYALSINGVEVIAGKRLKQGVAEGSLEEVDRRGFLRGLAAFAAVSAVPSGVVRALSTPEGINTLTTNDVNALLKAIRAYLPRYDQEDWTGTFERWDKMASVLRIHGNDDELGSDKLDKLMRLYRKDPEQASTKLLQHLQKHAVDLTDVRKQTISQWDDIETVRRSDPVNDEIRQMQQQIADYNARMQRSKTPGISAAQTATAAVTQFRDLVQQMLGADTTISQPPREKYMGRIEPTSSALALPAPDRSAAELMRDLQDRLDRPLTDQEKTIVQQEIIAATEKSKRT